MEKDRFKEIWSRLDEYHVQEPDIHLKTSKWDRFVRYLVSPTKDPQLFLISQSGAAVISGSVILIPFLLFILLLLI
ncbi:hypothetical protein ACTHQ4_17465 [Alkalicoccobacillus gibsonii]|uniref:hypothetical protein n=1 Tax=Alkalicoccobacillus gibsonii TaxID=79881 RepID=UPI003F7CB69E